LTAILILFVKLIGEGNMWVWTSFNESSMLR